MADLTLERFREALLELLAEAYEGPAQEWTWFVTHGDPHAGVLGTLGQLSAEQASRSAVEGGRSIAAHTEHLRWSLAFANTYMRGEVPDQNWEQSWAVQEVDAQQWQALQEALGREFRTLYQAIEQQSDFSDDMLLRGLMASVPHAAYHLGAIRQLARWVRC